MMGNKRHQDDDQRHHADQRHGGDILPERHQGDQRQGDAGQRAEQARAGHPFPHGRSQRRDDRLADPDHHQQHRADVPGKDHRLAVIVAKLFHAVLERGQEDQRADGDRARRIESQRHGRHVAAAAAAGQAEGKPGIDQIARHHAQGRAGDHLREDEIAGEAAVRHRVGRGDQRQEEDHHGHIVEDQPEEGVDIASLGPSVAGRHSGAFSVQGLPRILRDSLRAWNGLEAIRRRDGLPGTVRSASRFSLLPARRAPAVPNG